MAQAKKSVNVPSLTNNYPQSASVVSKLVKSDSTSIKVNPAEINLKDISISIRDKIATNEDILELFPDVELAIQILISSILSPNDMVNITLQYIPPTIALPSTVKQTLIDTFERHMEDNYDIVTKLPNILRESMFTKGAYIEAIIPEASLDDIISQTNVSDMSLESYLDRSNYKTSYLGKDTNKYSISAESFTEDKVNKIRMTTHVSTLPLNKKTIEITQEDIGLNITDNPGILLYSSRMLELRKKTAMSSISKAWRLSSEADEMELDNIFRSDTKYTPKDYVVVTNKDQASRESISKPLVMKLPVESVIPIHATSDPSKHLGYFIVLDENGNPLNIKEGMLEYNEAMQNMTFLNNSNSSSLIQKAKLALTGITKTVPVIQELETIYNTVVENMIKNKLKNGLYGELVDVNENADVFRVMLIRALKAQQTKVLFLPEELVAYYAFEYRDNGTGKSMLEKNTLLYSIRAILLFSRLMATIKNSVTNTVVTATLDEHDPDPEATREKIISESLKTRQATLPLGLIRPDDLTEWTHKVGFLYKIQHPALPNIELDVSDQSPNKTIPDEELDNKLAERILMSYGLTPEIVMAGYSSDFATTVASRNLLFAKRCTATQLVFMPQVTKHIQKIARNDITLVNKLTDIVKNNMVDIKKVLKKSDSEEDDINLKKISESKIVDYLVNKYINYIDIKLPAIVFTDANVLRSTFDTFVDNVTTYVEATFTSTVFNDMFGGKLNEQIDNIKEIIKAMAIMKWANTNNFIPEVNEIFTRNDEGNPEFDIFGEYLTYKEALEDLFVPFVKRVYKSRSKYDKKITEVLDDLGNVGMEQPSDTSGGDDNGATDTQPQDTGDSGGMDNTPDSGGDTGGEPTDMGNMEEPQTQEPVPEGAQQGAPAQDQTAPGETDTGAGGQDGAQDLAGMDDFDVEDLSGSGTGTGGGDDTGMGGPSKPLKRGERTNKEVELNEKLLDIRAKKEEALAEKAKAQAAEAKEKAGIKDEDEEGETDDENQDDKQDEGQEEQQADDQQDNEPSYQQQVAQRQQEQKDQAANEAFEFDLARTRVW